MIEWAITWKGHKISVRAQRHLEGAWCYCNIDEHYQDRRFSHNEEMTFHMDVNGISYVINAHLGILGLGRHCLITADRELIYVSGSV